MNICFPYKVDAIECKDIDLSRFVPTEVDNCIGITVATMDRFTTRQKTKPAAADDGETNRMTSDSLSHLFILLVEMLAGGLLTHATVWEY